MELFKIFVIILLVGLMCSTIPWLHLGLIMGFPAVVINSIMLTILYNVHRKRSKGPTV